jgi:hypothetical protein
MVPATLRAAAMAAFLAAGLTACERVEPAAAAGTATLTWTPVTRDTQGGALRDLAGYKVFYGTSARGLYSVVVVADPHLTSYVVHDLAPGSWYFAVAAYTTSNVEGPRSNVVAKNVN